MDIANIACDHHQRADATVAAVAAVAVVAVGVDMHHNYTIDAVVQRFDMDPMLPHLLLQRRRMDSIDNQPRMRGVELVVGVEWVEWSRPLQPMVLHSLLAS